MTAGIKAVRNERDKKFNALTPLSDVITDIYFLQQIVVDGINRGGCVLYPKAAMAWMFEETLCFIIRVNRSCPQVSIDTAKISLHFMVMIF